MNATVYNSVFVDRTIGQGLEFWADRQPDKPFMNCAGPWMSYGEAERRTTGIGAGLQAIDVSKGDRVALVSASRTEVALSLIALGRIGAISVPLNTYLKGEFLRFQINDCGASIVIADAAGLRDLALISDDLPAVRTILALDSTGDVELPRTLAVRPFASITCEHAVLRKVDILQRDPAAIIYTSGTTGMPKGCLLSQGYLTKCAKPAIEYGWIRNEDIIYSLFPLFHAAGFAAGLIGAIMAGSAIAIEPSFSARMFIHRVIEAGATLAFGIGAAGMAILATQKTELDRAHKLRMCSFPPMPPESQEEFEARFGVDVNCCVYGQTEITTISRSTTEEARKNRSSVGRPSSKIDLRLVDDADDPVPTGALGEIVVRPLEPELLFQGYWNRPDATVAVQRNLWHHTGDLGRLDAEGLLYFVDRKKDSIRRRGENVSSTELERAILKHPKIAAVAAFGVPSPLGEEDIKACIVLAENQTMDPVELFEFFKKSLPYFAVPRYVSFAEALPVNANGRVMKGVLREGGTGTALDFEALGLVVTRQERRS